MRGLLESMMDFTPNDRSRSSSSEWAMATTWIPASTAICTV